MNNSFENLRVCLLSVLVLAAVQVVIIFITNYTHLLIPIDLSKVAATAATEGSGKRGFQNDYIVEPSVGQLIADLLPKVLSQKLFTVLQDSNASEHAARTLAMQTATDNANELIQDLTKQYNKSRQQAITNELLDIIAGSLK